MLEKLRLNYLINKKQSLKYQIMLILMEEHKRARLGDKFIGSYNGGNELLFDSNTWNKMKNKIEKYISDNYKDDFKKSDVNYILGLFSKEQELCSLEIYNKNIRNIADTNEEDEINILSTNFEAKNISESEYIIFYMTDKGYSYQYNGYKKTQDKLQHSANLFVLMTLIYYIVSWIFPNFDAFKKSTNDNVIQKIYTLFFKDNVTIKIIFVLVIWESAKIIWSKIYKK